MTQLAFLRSFLRLIWTALGLWLLAWLAFQNLPPSGWLTVRVHAGEPSGFIGGFTPSDRAGVIQEEGRLMTRVTGEPAYFPLATPRFFKTAAVRVRYRNDRQPIIEIGPRTSLKDWTFDLKPLEAGLLDGLGWPARDDGPYRIYEKKATSRSAAEILSAPTDGRTAVYHADPVRWGMRLPASNRRSAEFVGRLPGSRSMYVYADAAPLFIELEFEGPASDIAEVKVLHEAEPVLSRRQQGAGTLELEITNAKPGLYRIDALAPETMALLGVRTRHPKLVFLDTEGEHLKAFRPEDAFEPEFPVVTWETDFKKAPYTAVVAGYRPSAVESGGWKVAEAEIDLQSAAKDQGQTQMVLSLPALKHVGGSVTIDWIEAEYRREPFSLGDLKKLFAFSL